MPALRQQVGVRGDAPDCSREVGINNQLLLEEAQRHYLSHRVCCRQWAHTFCRECQRVPYHSGFNCALYEVYLAADKCTNISNGLCALIYKLILSPCNFQERFR